MKLVRSILWITLATAVFLSAAPPVHAQCGALPEKKATAEIRNFLRINKDFCTGGQPRVEQLAALKAEGITTIINLRPPTEHRAAEEEAAAKQLGLRYFNIPVVFTSPRDEDADAFLKVMDDKQNRPAFIHCTAAIRAGAFWMIYRVLREGWDVERAEKEAYDVGLRHSQHLNDFARAYIAKHKPRAAAAAAPSAAPAAGARRPDPAVEGLDPVLLVQGTEKQGDAKLSIVRNGFEYMFASAETKATFEKDPARYEIQLGGLCARMGGTTLGNADLWAVADGRIYVFGSEECQKRFKAAPQKFLEPARGAMASSKQAAKDAHALLEKAAAAMGGAAKLDALTSVQRTEVHTLKRNEQEVTYRTMLATDFTRWRTVREFGNGASLTYVIAPDDSFGNFSRGDRNMPNDLTPPQRDSVEKQLLRDPLLLLHARKRDGFVAAAAGAGAAGTAAVRLVTVDYAGVRVTLGIEPKSGEVLMATYADRGPEGEYGTVQQLFSDFREVGGLRLPHRVAGTWNGLPHHAISYGVESVAVNQALPATVFERPRRP